MDRLPFLNQSFHCQTIRNICSSFSLLSIVWIEMYLSKQNGTIRIPHKYQIAPSNWEWLWWTVYGRLEGAGSYFLLNLFMPEFSQTSQPRTDARIWLWLILHLRWTFLLLPLFPWKEYVIVLLSTRSWKEFTLAFRKNMVSGRYCKQRMNSL